MKLTTHFLKGFQEGMAISIVGCLAVFIIALSLFAGCDPTVQDPNHDTEIECDKLFVNVTETIFDSSGQALGNVPVHFNMSADTFEVIEIGPSSENIDEAYQGDGEFILRSFGTDDNRVIQNCKTYQAIVIVDGFEPYDDVIPLQVELDGRNSINFELVLQREESSGGDAVIVSVLDAALINRCQVITNPGDCDIIFTFTSLNDRFGNCEILLESNGLTPIEANNNCCTIFQESNGTPLLPAFCP